MASQKSFSMKYFFRKVLALILTLFVVSVLVFLAFSLIPGDPAIRKLGTEGTPEQLAALREQMGLNAPLHERYFSWVGALFHGDLGISYYYDQSVSSLLKGMIPVTLSLALLSFVFTILISVPFGILTAKYENSLLDRFIVIMNQVVMSIPPFFSGIIFSALFGLVLKWFTPGDYISYEESLVSFLGYLILPAICIALPKAAMAIKLLRSSMIAEAAKDYTRTAYSRGNTINGVLYGHVLKNAMIPVSTFLGRALADMLAGSIVVEKIFGIPGISNVLIASISNRDYPVVEAVIMGIALIIVVINLIVDIVYQLIDPRIRV